MRHKRYIRLHTQGNTWKYTLDIGRLRVAWCRLMKVNTLGIKVPHVAFGIG